MRDVHVWPGARLLQEDRREHAGQHEVRPVGVAREVEELCIAGSRLIKNSLENNFLI